jgi:peptide deformylase
MALLPIKLYGEPVLREKARELTQGDVDADFRTFVRDMGETMYENAGVGLAANQVGDLRRVFVVDVAQVDGNGKRGRRRKDPSRRELLVFLNPEVVESSPEDEAYNEGCLSIPEVEADVYRSSRVRVRYRTLDWQQKEQWMDGLLARVFQHELDHLNGVLFIDHLPEDTRRKLAGALNKIKKSVELSEA